MPSAKKIVCLKQFSNNLFIRALLTSILTFPGLFSTIGGEKHTSGYREFGNFCW